MTRSIGTIAMGIRTPIVKEKENIKRIIIDSLIKASINHNFEFKDNDIVAITEGIVAKSEGNVVSLDEICLDLKSKFPNKKVGLVFPILSRNRFSLILKAIASYIEEITILISFPKDEVGNSILDEQKLIKSKYNKI